MEFARIEPAQTGPQQTESRARFVAMLLADARLPAGGSAHSAGLEAAVQAGLELGDVPRYIEARLRSLTRLDAGAAVLAHRIATDWDATGEARLRRLDRSIGARTPSAALRAAARLLGRGLARVGATLAPDSAAVAALAENAPFRAVAMGVVSAALDLDERGAVLAICYDEAQSVASAALKLLPADPSVTMGWVLASRHCVDEILTEALSVAAPSGLPAPGAPQIESWTEIHSHERRRLFVS
jgi:urease accessory protein